jgi:predicted nucleotidyltransferase
MPQEVEPHHAETIRNVVRKFEAEPAVRALLLTGSIAHGFAKPDADVDIAIIVTADEFARRRAENRLTFFDRSLCTYPEGYVDGKFMDEDFLREVARHGSEPARYAFDGARILFSRIEGLERQLAAIVRYPVEAKTDRIARFAAQLVGWRWFFSEGVKKDSAYLKILAVQKVVLFSCRIVLAENELLFPFHKWMLRVTLAAPRLPDGFGASIERILAAPTFELIDAHCRATLAFAGLDHDAVNATWGANFMRDTELRWMTDSAAIDDC